MRGREGFGVVLGGIPFRFSAIILVVALASFGGLAVPGESHASGAIAIAAGGNHTLSLSGIGTVTAWGDDSDGQCDVPSGLSGVIAIAAGGAHSVALKADGTVVAWGSNEYGQCTVPSGLSEVVSISAGANHTLALKSDGSVVGWGRDNSGQATVPEKASSGVIAISAGGDHNLAIKSNYSLVTWGENDDDEGFVPPIPSGFVAIAAGYHHTLALRSDGLVLAWGNDDYGQVDRPSTVSSGVIAIAAGYHHSIAIKSDGAVVTWGDDSDGQVHIPATATNGVIAIAAGYHHTVALKTDGTVLAWGNNDYGQCTVPSMGSLGAVAISSGGWHNAALTNQGRILAWGNNDYDQITVPSGALAGMTSVGTGTLHTLAVKSAGYAVAWGDDSEGQSTVPGQALLNVTAVDGGLYHSVARKSDGTVIAWGNDDSGQCDVPSTLSGAIGVAAGSNHAVALKGDGSVVAWGSNSNGQCTVPSGLSGVKAVAAGYTHTMALKSDGTVVAWGDNAYGQRSVPSGLTGVKAIAAGGYHSLALKADGTVVAWGRDDYGQCDMPADYSGRVKAISAGGRHSLAITSDGVIHPWGSSSAPTMYTVTVVPSGTVNPVQPVRITADMGGLDCSWDGSSASSCTSGGYFKGTPIVLTADLPPETVVSSWNGCDSYTATTCTLNSLTTNASVSLVTAASFVVSTYAGTGGSVTPAGSQTVDFGETASFTVVPDSGYRLRSISGCGGTMSGATYTTGPITADCAIMLKFELNSAPTAQSDTYTFNATPGEPTVVLAGSGVLVNDTDPNSDLPLKAYLVQGPSHHSGNFALQTDGSFVYRHDGTDTGNDSFTYFVRDLWGYASSGATVTLVPGPVSSRKIIAIAAGDYHSLALRRDGTVVAWGSNSNGQCDVPDGLSDVIAIAGGGDHSVALKEDGTVVAWGNNGNGQCTVPTGLSNVVAIAAGGSNSAALKSDGSVVVWGTNGWGQCEVPSSLSNVVGMAVGRDRVLALKSDGTVVLWGDTAGGRSVPSGLSGVIAVAAGAMGSLALKGDGTVVKWGDGYSLNNTTIRSGITAISLSYGFTAFLKSDGGAVEATSCSICSNWTSMPAAAESGVVAVAAGTEHFLALKEDGTLLGWGCNGSRQIDVPQYTVTVSPSGSVPSGRSVEITSDVGSLDCSWDGTNASGCVSGIIDAGTGVVLTASLPTNTVISSWSGCDSSTATTCTIDSLSADTTISVVTLASYSVTASPGTGGSLDVSTPSPQTVAHDTMTGFIFNADTGYHVSRVSGCGGKIYSNTSNGVTTLTYVTRFIESDCTVSAEFALNTYAVTPSAGANGSLDPATAQAVSHGSTTSFTVVPDSGYRAGTVTGCGGSLSGTVYTTGAITADCTVTASFVANVAPVASADSYDVDLGQTLVVSPSGILANDSDADGDALTASLVSAPSHNSGAFSLGAGGGFTYTHDGTRTGSDHFTYKARDSWGGESAETTVTLVLHTESEADTDLSVSPSSRLFGVEELGNCDSSTPVLFTVTNAGPDSRTLGTLSLGGFGGNDFSIGTDGCSGKTLVKDASCTVVVKFCPTGKGSKAANLLIPSDDPETPVLTAFLYNHESAAGEAARRIPPVLYALDVPEETVSGTTYDLTWSLLGYDASYQSNIVFFDCTGITGGSCGSVYATHTLESGNLDPISCEAGEWTYSGNTSTYCSYTYRFTAPVVSVDTDMVVRFYAKDNADGEAGRGSLSLLIPGNLSATYYDHEGRRILKVIRKP